MCAALLRSQVKVFNGQDEDLLQGNGFDLEVSVTNKTTKSRGRWTWRGLYVGRGSWSDGQWTFPRLTSTDLGFCRQLDRARSDNFVLTSTKVVFDRLHWAIHVFRVRGWKTFIVFNYGDGLRKRMILSRKQNNSNINFMHSSSCDVIFLRNSKYFSSARKRNTYHFYILHIRYK